MRKNENKTVKKKEKYDQPILMVNCGHSEFCKDGAYI